MKEEPAAATVYTVKPKDAAGSGVQVRVNEDQASVEVHVRPIPHTVLCCAVLCCVSCFGSLDVALLLDWAWKQSLFGIYTCHEKQGSAAGIRVLKLPSVFWIDPSPGRICSI